jgi:acyl-CoA thioester hydrolase
MFVHETKLRVRYGETDQMGVVYYGNYALYYEVGRVEALRSLGLSYREVEAGGVLMPVLEMSSRYLAPARYDDPLTIKTVIRDKPGVRIRFEHEISNASAQLLHTGMVTLVFINAQTGKPTRCPEQLAEELKPFFRKEAVSS